MSSPLADYLRRLEERKPQAPFELGLERIVRVASALGVQPPAPVITVAGTNGKGSCCAYLEAILAEAGYRPGCFYSPHLLDFTERIRVDGAPADEASLLEVFAEVERADDGGGQPLSYFEFIAVAAALLYSRAGCRATVFEVGLGGRLDAVNAFDPDLAVITSVGIDHVELLGPDRESIGAEKAGIMRPGLPVVAGDIEPPASVLAKAAALGCDLRVRGRDFRTAARRESWDFYGVGCLRAALPRPAMPGSHQIANAACALAALEALEDRLPVSQGEIKRGLTRAHLPGRFEVLPGRVPVVLDVAHNGAAARVLADTLLDMGHFDPTIAVLGVRKRKNAAQIVAELARRIDQWHAAPVAGEDPAHIEEAMAAAREQGGEATVHPSVAAAAAAAHTAATGDRSRIVVTGSFSTVEEYLCSDAARKKAA